MARRGEPRSVPKRADDVPPPQRERIGAPLRGASLASCQCVLGRREVRFVNCISRFARAYRPLCVVSCRRTRRDSERAQRRKHSGETRRFVVSSVKGNIRRGEGGPVTLVRDPLACGRSVTRFLSRVSQSRACTRVPRS